MTPLSAAAGEKMAWNPKIKIAFDQRKSYFNHRYCETAHSRQSLK
jgi:hypothetical protein